MSGRSGPTRRRDAGATRAALLEAAAALFAEQGYERTTVREVAARAGVNQALLFRYFGSKEELFAEVLAAQNDELLAGPAETLLPRVLADLLRDTDPAWVRRALQAVLRSVGHAGAAELLRERLGAAYGSRLASLSSEPDAELRADLVIAWLFGIGLLRSVVGKRPLADADPDQVTALVLRTARHLLGDPPAAGSGD
ncbi:TetR/AcrR family transcriptional regulator [Streptoalloteichus tenebrarius]|uniref:TetR/AcrR family transcriptional regulator n=1 Tax=Streptoalloteichus tenebrarius (strain ATCC 17920 / DSM 40477 / JCM 4838 / CBS 697.72 / NBRC 16177 / NCIMB 11028 / NRRL B-12390 / A12253. 1 / ISP 5477) TaxID=1933 RepID=UPI0020A37C9E|nr:TetR family transcriptional regulator [Streptoalloteichus tenebrarius]